MVDEEEMKKRLRELEEKLKDSSIIKISPGDLSEAKDPLERYVSFYLGASALIGESVGKKVGIDVKSKGWELIKAGTVALDKLFRMTMEHRKDKLYGKFKEDEMREITILTAKEYLLGKGILPENETEEVLKGMKKYEEAFENELKFYEIEEEDDKIKNYSIKRHDTFKILGKSHK
ncbi:MAG: hypothetical protein J7L45_00150 [Candidatus Aenigmarchaeota archaeon]|nr:hypothetical protein [Candidatus Aenigmarchaeota archaeon]